MASKSFKSDLVVDLCEAFLDLETVEDVYVFLMDLCTPKELKDFAERWAVCQLIAQNKTYRAIRAETGVSLTTIGRVARFLQSEPYGGYKRVLKKREKKYEKFFEK
ncbi:hypothetical protein AGMMS49949_02560 [Alphaproteobacteria bacterium]|nr:hypothetical protein AGMMS49949_02560 [Alphaproteobacteria bacterium]GHS95857.1 hypothetical protein AGMMS50296_1190 [Alphaproteobacteria bacterium]